MKNISASILRELVATIFKIKATSVILSEVINPEYRQESGSTSGGMWDQASSQFLHGFNPEKGFVSLSEFGGTFWNDGHDGPCHEEKGTPLCDIPGVDDFIFFVEVKHEAYSCPSNAENRDNTSYTIFKAANFVAYRDKINKEDIARWEQWINAEEK